MKSFVRAGLDIPVITHGVEIAFVNASGLDGTQSGEDVVDPEQARHRGTGRQGESLGQIPDLAHGLNLSARGCEDPGDELEKRGLAGAVAADEARAARVERPVHPRECGSAVRPREMDVTQRNNR